MLGLGGFTFIWLSSTVAVIQLKLHLSCQYFNYTLNNCFFFIFYGVRILRLIFLYEEGRWKLDMDTKAHKYPHTYTNTHTMNACDSALYP